MTDRIIEDLDLHAYIDGLLDDDPTHKASVEAYLRQSPEAMQRVEDIRAQNAALQQAFGARIADPVPQRLYDALEGRPRQNGRRAALRAAGLTAALLATGVTGWLVGTGGSGERMVSGVVDRSFAHFAAEPIPHRQAPSTAAAVSQSTNINLMADGTGVGMHAPDLSQAGYTLIGEHRISAGDTRMIRLDYSAADALEMTGDGRPAGDQGFSLFVSPRWEPASSGITAAERDDVSVVYWLDGPYISTLVTRMPEDIAKQAAAAVREAMATQRQRPQQPQLKPEMTAPTFESPTMPPTPIQPSSDQTIADTITPADRPPAAQGVPLRTIGDSVQH